MKAKKNVPLQENYVLLDMKRGHAYEEDCGVFGIYIFVYPLRPCLQYSCIGYWPIDLIVFRGPLIERSSSVLIIQKRKN